MAQDAPKRRFLSLIFLVSLLLSLLLTGGMSDECQRYHSRLAELLAVKKQENYASTITLGLESHLPF